MPKIETLFKTPYAERERQYIESGNGEHEPEYGYEINKTGQKVLVIKGYTNLYDKIQEQLESTKIENILKSVANGDTSQLRPDGIYGDVSEAPKNLIEARKMILALENTWAGLTPEQRKEFDNDVEKFVSESGSMEWFNKLGYSKETEEVKIETNEIKKESEETV